MKVAILQHVRFFAAMSIASVAFSASAGQLDKIRESKTITIAHRDASIPFSYLDSDGKPIGYAMDLCLKVAEAIRLDLKLPTLTIKYLPVTSANRMAAITEGKAALECGSTTNTADRRKQVDYTLPHFISSARFLVRKNEQIGRIEDLAGKVVASTKGTTILKTLDRLNSERALNYKVVQAADHAEAFNMVVERKADAFAMDDVLLFGLRANAPDPKKYEVVGKPMTIEPYAIMIPKNDAPFKSVVDREMRRLMQSGEINAMYKKWFMSPIPPNNVNLDLPTSLILREAFKFPSDKVGDLVD